MQTALQRIFSLFIKTDPLKKRRKFKGQSLVEVAISFPILIMLFAGVVEFGFIMNYYLSLVDATRDSARRYSSADPYCNEITPTCPVVNPTVANSDFYLQAAKAVRNSLDPSWTYEVPTDYKGRRIVLDPAHDDVIVTVYGVTGATAKLCRAAGAYHLFPTEGDVNGNYLPIFTATDIQNTRVTGAPNAGVLMVEVHYNYHQVLALPWMTTWLANPLPLRAYTIMPIKAAEPPGACT